MRNFFAKLTRSSTVTVNGRTYEGSNVSIINGRVIIDGKEVADQTASPAINVVIHGDAEKVETAAGDITVNGSVGELSTVSGDVKCGAVSGSVSSVSGDIRCPSIQGPASSVSGDIG